MDNPAKAARRLLLGTAGGLFLVTFLALREGRLPLEFNIGWSIPIAAVIAIGMAVSIPLESGSGSGLTRLFPAMDDESVAKDIEQRLDDGQKVGVMSGPWAELEKAMLSEELGESE